MKRQKGRTLVELIVVMTIIGILLAIVCINLHRVFKHSLGIFG